MSYDFDKGFGDIAAAASHYALVAGLACSASLRFYGHMLLYPKKSYDFSGALPTTALGATPPPLQKAECKHGRLP